MPALIGIVCAATSAQADPAATAPFAFFVNVASDGIADKAGADAAHNFVFHGIPLTVATEHQSADSGPGVTAGINGQHIVDLGGGLSITGKATLSKMHAMRAALLDVGQGMDVAARATLRYHAGNLDLNVAPRINAPATALAGRRPEYGFDSSISEKLADAWMLSLASNYTRQGEDAITAGQSGTEGFSISYQFAPATEIHLGYDYCWSWQSDDTGSVSQGPSIGTTFSPMEALDLVMKYSYGAISNAPPASIGADWFDDGSHHLDFNADWDLTSQGISGATIGASYAVQRDTAASDMPVQQSAAINIALDF
jgi:hypothetical protein